MSNEGMVSTVTVTLLITPPEDRYLPEEDIGNFLLAIRKIPEVSSVSGPFITHEWAVEVKVSIDDLRNVDTYNDIRKSIARPWLKYAKRYSLKV
jgi:hypothetical protein